MLPGSRRHVLWISPHWLWNVFLEQNFILDRVFNILGILSDRFVVPYFWQVSDFKRTKNGWLLAWGNLLCEFSFGSICLSEWVKCSMLFDAVFEWILFIKYLCHSPLVIKASHIFLSFILILYVRHSLFKKFWHRSCVCVFERLLWGASLVMVVFLHVLELGMLHQLMTATWLERTCNCFFTSICSEEVFTRIDVLATHSICSKLAKRFSSDVFASMIGNIFNSADLLSWSSVLLIVCGGISNSQRHWQRKKTASLTHSSSHNVFCKFFSIWVITSLFVS